MSKQNESKTCQFCHGILFEEDDVVVCPDCGAPHHRACWQKLGKCALEELHGTENQYDIAQKAQAENLANAKREAANKGEVLCENCGKSTMPSNRFCPHCGSPMKGEKLGNEEGGKKPPYFAFFAPLENFADDEQIAPDVSAKEMSAFLGIRAFKYLPKFKQNRRVGWNLIAFFMPSVWFAFHKMYKQLVMALGAFFAGIICYVPFLSEVEAAVSTLPIPETSADQTQMVREAIVLALQSANPSALLLFMLGTLIISASMVLSGLFAERAYRTQAIEKITAIKQEDSIEDPLQEMAKKGGTNLFLALLVMILTISPEYIITLIMSLF